MGLSLRQLARVADINAATLVNVEKGNGCTPRIEQKLSKALEVAHGALWHPVPQRLRRELNRKQDCRWLFVDQDEGKRYFEMHHLADEADFRRDPEEIQDEKERLRLGRNGLSSGFLFVTSALLTEYDIASGLLECYGRVHSPARAAKISTHYCLRGDLRLSFAEETIVLETGDSLALECRDEHWVEPLHPVGQHDLPPLMTYAAISPLPPL